LVIINSFFGRHTHLNTSVNTSKGLVHTGDAAGCSMKKKNKGDGDDEDEQEEDEEEPDWW
jgi:hypothetical protein